MEPKIEIKMSPQLEKHLQEGMIPLLQILLDTIADLEKRVAKLEQNTRLI